MKRGVRATLAVALLGTSLATGAQAACPEAPDHADAESQVLTQLARAPNAAKGQDIAAGLWRLYLDAPDRAAQTLLDEGMAHRRYGDLEASLGVLDELIAYCPGYAEGWNQRAFTRYLQGQFEGALADLDEALRLNPRHVPAMSGKALTLIGMGRGEAAQSVLRQALKLNPWLPERAYLVSDPGEDI